MKNCGVLTEVLDHLAASPLATEFRLPEGRAREALNFSSEDDVEPLAGNLLQLFRVLDDGAAFELLVELTQAHLSRQAARICRQLAVILDPDDLVASLLARLFTDVRRDQPVVHRFFGLSYRTMRFEALNQLRLERRARKRGETWESMKALQLRRSDPADLACDREESLAAGRLGVLVTALVVQALHCLSHQDRRVLWHRELEGLDYDQLAEAMQKPRKQIGMVLKRARDRLGSKLEASLVAHRHVLGESSPENCTETSARSARSSQKPVPRRTRDQAEAVA
ncbi:MAG: hypothetical protein DHS20C15_20290 [Planctomycetota bacterium]|nr:MAG: hypothetical protein DHS20C15_20290 [Planctomycetota bacterium]